MPVATLDGQEHEGGRKVKELKPHQLALMNGYQAARESPNTAVRFQYPEEKHGELVGRTGKLQNSFLLPTEDSLGLDKSIRLPKRCFNPKLHEIRYSPEDSGFWLRFTGKDKKGDIKEVHVLVYENKSGEDAITTKEYIEIARRSEELCHGYEVARREGIFYFPKPDIIRDDIVSNIGKLQRIFSLPNGGHLDSQPGIGLPKSCINPKLHEIRYSPEENGFWLRFTAQDGKTGHTKEVHLLIHENKSGKPAITTALEPHQYALLKAYQAARKSPEHGIPFKYPDDKHGDLVGSQSKLKRSFLLPNGKQLKLKSAIGLPTPGTNPKLHEIRYSPHENGFWLRFSAQDINGVPRAVHVLIDENKRGQDALTSFEPHQYAALKTYQAAERFPDQPIPFQYPDDKHGDLVSDQGLLQQSFLLPNRDTPDAPLHIKLPHPCTNQKLHEIRYSPEERGFWVKVSAVSSTGRTKVVEVLLSEEPGVTGEAAILEKRILGTPETMHREPLPPEFERTDVSQARPGKNRRASTGEVSAHVQRKPNGVTFVKGEAFEQVVGLLLALKYPEETVTPQYCLKVGLNSQGRGFYGMRADYRVGSDKIFEVKWGGATSNIKKTYDRHSEQLKKAENLHNASYKLILLENNPDLTVPYSLFADELEGISKNAPFLVNETQALILELTNSKNALSLEGVRDYLYDTSVQAQKINESEKRSEFIEKRLADLIFQEPDNLNAFLKESTLNFFNSLEANFEWKGKLHTNCIDPLSYYQEHPETFSIQYSFDASHEDLDRSLPGPRRPHTPLTFASQLDRDLAVACEVITDKLFHEWLLSTADDDGVNRTPFFKFGEDLFITTHPDAPSPRSGARVVVISSLSDLRNHGEISQLQGFQDNLAFVEGYLSRFGGIRV